MNHLLHSHSLKYRADIDGLRAIAILSVVFFHVCNFGGGFVGVDIFFVISGFLISKIIAQDLENNRFSFGNFYARRVRRIFPALLLVLMFSCCVGCFVLFPFEYTNLNKSIFRASYFVSNFHFLKESSDYFHNASESKPLLHLWSLAIEEQFYIFWPLILWLSWKLRIDALKVILLGVAASFTFGLYKISSSREAAFYLPQSRCWELLIGALLAYVEKKWPVKNLRLSNLSSLFGFLLIIAALSLITKEKTFPGWWALLPTVGTALVIFAGSQAWLNRKILQNSLLVWFGLISFPLYLWHWPLLSFLEITQNGTATILTKSLVVLLATLLAWLTYRFVEIPLRFNNKSKNVIITLAVLMISLGSFAGLSYRFNLLQVYKKDGLDLVRTDSISRAQNKTCEIFKVDHEGIICLTASNQPEIMIIGDSHATSLNSAVYQKKIDLNTVLVSANSCLPFNKYAVDKDFEYDDCPNLAAQIKFLIQELQTIKTVVISTYSPEEQDFEKYQFAPQKNMTSSDIFLAGYDELVSELLAAGKKVIFVVDVPKLNDDPKLCVARILQDKPFSECKMEKKSVLAKEQKYRAIVKELKRRNPRLSLFYSSDVLCDHQYCYGRDAKNVFYYDPHHLSVSGSKKILEKIFFRDGESNHRNLGS